MVTMGGTSFGLLTPFLTTTVRRGGGPPSISTSYGTTSVLPRRDFAAMEERRMSPEVGQAAARKLLHASGFTLAEAGDKYTPAWLRATSKATGRAYYVVIRTLIAVRELAGAVKKVCWHYRLAWVWLSSTSCSRLR